MQKNSKKNELVKNIVKGIKPIQKRGTPEGESQREEFRRRWGVSLDDLNK